jgi:hypothetical protein
MDNVSELPSFAWMVLRGAKSLSLEKALGAYRRQTQQSRLELGLCLSIDSEGRTIWIVDAYRAEAVIIFSLSLRPLDGYPLVHREKAYP